MADVKEQKDERIAEWASGKYHKIRIPPLWQREGPHDRKVKSIALKDDADIGDDAFGPGHFAGPIVKAVLERAAESAGRCLELGGLRKWKRKAEWHGRSLTGDLVGGKSDTLKT